jgi:hypothetical protein
VEQVALPQPPRWAVWSSGFLLVAGILHLTALPAHAEQARGLGLFFLGLGAAQVVWACLTLFRSTQLGARIGLAMLSVAPVVLWVLTRTLRAPWSAAPEPVDILSLGTVVLQLAAAVAMVLGRAGVSVTDQGAPSMARRTLVVFVAIGIAFGAVGYAGALAAEVTVPWLGEPEESHHGDGAGTALEGEAPHDESQPHGH